MENEKSAPVCETGAAIEKEMYAPVKVPESMTTEDALEFLGIMCFLQEYDCQAPTAYRYSYTKLRERVTQTLRTAFSEKAATSSENNGKMRSREVRLRAENAELRKTLAERKLQIHQMLTILDEEKKERKMERTCLVCLTVIVIICLFALNG